MERELDPSLTYHNLDHTFGSVLPSAMMLADLYHLKPEDQGLLAVAAAFHDIGWTIQGTEHERIGVEIARQVLPQFGFNGEQIATIGGIIMATRLPPSPSNLLEEIMADADLDVLGRDDFWPRNHDLRVELESNGRRYANLEWYQEQLDFLVSHHYFTQAARQLRHAGLQKNIGQLKALVMAEQSS